MSNTSNYQQKKSSTSSIGFINETVECANDMYNAHLVRTGAAKTIAEASMMSRDIHCPCSKCNNLKR